jgi:hypothetical protein
MTVGLVNGVDSGAAGSVGVVAVLKLESVHQSLVIPRGDSEKWWL